MLVPCFLCKTSWQLQHVGQSFIELPIEIRLSPSLHRSSKKTSNWHNSIQGLEKPAASTLQGKSFKIFHTYIIPHHTIKFWSTQKWLAIHDPKDIYLPQLQYISSFFRLDWSNSPWEAVCFMTWSMLSSPENPQRLCIGNHCSSLTSFFKDPPWEVTSKMFEPSKWCEFFLRDSIEVLIKTSDIFLNNTGLPIIWLL